MEDGINYDYRSQSWRLVVNGLCTWHHSYESAWHWQQKYWLALVEAAHYYDPQELGEDSSLLE